MIGIENYLFTLPVVVLAYWYFIPRKWRGNFLSICSISFVALFSIKYTFYFMLNIAVIYLVGILMGRGHKNRRLLLRLVLIWLIGNLCFFKYTNLVLNAIFKIDSAFFCKIEFQKVLFPLGLSYIIFRLIHYIVEVYRDNAPITSFMGLVLYILFFPTFLAGPIERSQRFHPQISATGSLDISDVNCGLIRIIRGLVRKIIIADNLKNIIIPIIASPQSYNRAIVILAVYGLAVQIYMDFAGYTDIAIGTSRLFGYRIMENFDRPFFKKNIALFWRSWHISLYSWIRDYFFFPLFGYRASRAKIYIGILCTMLLFMLWHRGNLNFLILGLYHGSGLMIWTLFQEIKRKSSCLMRWTSNSRLDPVASLITFSFVSFGFIFFRDDFSQSLRIIQRLLNF